MSEIVDGVLPSVDEIVTDVGNIWDMMGKSVATGEQVLTGGTIQNIFTIGTPGPIEVLSLVGRFTEAVSADPCDLKLILDPIPGTDTDMCLVVDIDSAGLDSWIYLDGVIGNAAILADDGTALPRSMAIPLVLPYGTVDMDLSNSDPTTGAIIWYMSYRPMNTGIVVTGLA